MSSTRPGTSTISFIIQIIGALQTGVRVDRASCWEVKTVKSPSGDDYKVLETRYGIGLNELRLTVPFGIGLVGHCAQTGEEIVVSDAYQDVRFNKNSDATTGYRTVSVACIPVVCDGEVVAVIQAINRLCSEDEGGRPVVIKDGNGGSETLWICDFSEDDMNHLREVSKLAGTVLENERLSAEAQQLSSGIVLAILDSIDYRDGITGTHTKNVTVLAVAVAHCMNLSPEEIGIIEVAAMLHDAGKLNVPDDILCSTARFGPREFEIMQGHTTKGHVLLQRHLPPRLKRAAEVGALMHHERCNGTGYPAGLYGDDIPLLAKIIAAADVIEALSGKRSYRESVGIRAAWEYCRDRTAKGICRTGKKEDDPRDGVLFDSDIIASFEPVIDEVEKNGIEGLAERLRSEGLLQRVFSENT